MIHINLLPIKQIKQRAAAKQQLGTVFISFLLLLVILAVISFFQASKAAQLEKDISQLNIEKQRHTKTLNLIKKLEKDKALFEKVDQRSLAMMPCSILKEEIYMLKGRYKRFFLYVS